MVDFSSLLDARAGEVKKPKALPPGDYPGVITNWTPVEAPKDKEYKTIIRLSLKLTDWAASVDEEDRLQDGPNGPTAINLAARNLRRDYYDHRMFDLDQLFADCGIEMEEAGRRLTYRELLPKLIGCQVMVEVQQYVSSRGEPGNQVNNLRPIQ
jgi:hypothetical protein